MKHFYSFNSKNFYGKWIPVDTVPGLRAEVCHGKMQGRDYSYITFSDDRGIKWRILPVRLSRTGSPTAIKAVARDRRVGERPRHEQASPSGFNELVAYIQRREAQERQEGDVDLDAIWDEVMQMRESARGSAIESSEANQTVLSLAL